MRPYCDTPVPMFSDWAVICVCPPCAGALALTGVFWSVKFAASIWTRPPPSWVRDNGIRSEVSIPAYLPAGFMSRGCRKLLPSLCAP